MSQPGLSAFEIVDLGSARVPAQRLPGLVQQRFVTNEKPSVRPVFSSRPLLIFERLASGQRLLSVVAQSLDVVGMKDPITKVRFHYVISGEAGVIQHCLIGINDSAVLVQDRDRLRNDVDYLL